MFDTGRFSRMARVSKRTLRYYDSIDLFKPVRVDNETGIRYYGAEQMVELNQIISLKELGLSLDQIRAMLADNLSSQEIYSMLLRKKAEAEQRLLADLRRLRGLEARLQSPEHYLAQGVVLKSVPACSFLSFRSTFRNDELLALCQRVIETVPQRTGRHDIGQFTTLMYNEAFNLDKMDVELGYLMPKSLGMSVLVEDGITLEERTLPPVAEMASVVVVGGTDRNAAGYETVTTWCAQNGYAVNTPERHIVLDLPNDANPDNMVIELQFPVEPLQVNPTTILNEATS